MCQYRHRRTHTQTPLLLAKKEKIMSANYSDWTYSERHWFKLTAVPESDEIRNYYMEKKRIQPRNSLSFIPK